MSARSRSIIIFLTLWCAVIIGRMAYLASGFSEKFRIESETVSGKTFKLPALRGAILDCNGKKLVWSEKFFRLTISGTLNEHENIELKKVLSSRNIPENIPLDYEIDDLTSHELIALEKSVCSTPALHISSVTRRRRIDLPRVAQLAGEISSETGCGVSGWEKEYDSILRGSDGTFRITRDRNGRMIKGSGEIKKMPVPGRDIKLGVSLEELQK